MVKDQDTILLSSVAWKQKAQEGENLHGLGLIKTFIPEELKVDDSHEDGLPRVKFVISTDSRDRDADTIAVKGWQLENYLKNPVVLYGHHSSGLPIGQSVEMTTRGKLTSVARFDTDIMEHPLPRAVVALLRRGSLRAASVGFIPWEWEQADQEKVPDHQRGRYPLDFTKQELVEWSVVPVPSNPEALLQARSAGIDISPIVNWAGEVLDMYGGAAKQGLWVSRSVLEQVSKIGSTATIVASPKGGWDIQASKEVDVEEEVEPEKEASPSGATTVQTDETKTPDSEKEEPKKSEPSSLFNPSSLLSDFDRMRNIQRDEGNQAYLEMDGLAILLSGEVQRTSEVEEWAIIIRDNQSDFGTIRTLPGVYRAEASQLAMKTLEQKKDPNIQIVLALWYGDDAQGRAAYVEQVRLSWKDGKKKDSNQKTPSSNVEPTIGLKDVMEAMGASLGPALKKAIAEAMGKVDE